MKLSQKNVVKSVGIAMDAFSPPFNAQKTAAAQQGFAPDAPSTPAENPTLQRPDKKWANDRHNATLVSRIFRFFDKNLMIMNNFVLTKIW